MPNRPSHPQFTVGGDLDELRLSVRITGDDLDPAAITRTLGIEPTFAARKGDMRESAGQRIVQRTGVWYIDLAESSEWVIDDAITTLLTHLPADPEVWHGLAETHSIDLLCGAFLFGWNRSFVLAPATLEALAARHMALSVDIYCEEERR
jgi:hypothetical protein